MHTPLDVVYRQWPAALLLALAAMSLREERARAVREAEGRRELAHLMALAFHQPGDLHKLPPVTGAPSALPPIDADLARLRAAAATLPDDAEAPPA